MLLTKLEMQGFKSFADKTEFGFRQGITAVVGPNGCGKSNVVDAVRWILGEQRPRAIRGSEMMDVIFNGTAARRSLGYAEASLTFLNDRGILPTEYSEVCVTRRLYRSGESQYFINKQLCRLRDIRQLFMDTGVGVDTYSIIEQGKIDRFIQSNAKERRVIFEEAAGISRYKAQRLEAQRRLERTRINLQKVDIKLGEERKQLRSIKYQAAKARRFRAYSERLRELVVGLSVRNYREWAAQRKAVRERIAVQEDRDRRLEAELKAIAAAMEQLEGELAGIERSRAEKRDEMHRVSARMDALQTGIEHNKQRIVEFQEETELCTRNIWSLNEKLRQARENLEAARKELAEIRDAIGRQGAAIAAETEKAAAAGQARDRIAQAIEEWKNRTIQVIEKTTTLRNELNHMDTGRRQQLARRSRLSGQLEEKAAENARIDEEIGRLTGRRDEIGARLAERAARQRERETELARRVEEHEALEKELRELRRREASLLSRREILQDLDMKAEDIENGVKRILRQDGQAEGFEILGMVADLVRADLKHAAAIEAALGDAAQFVVTRTEKDAGSAAALLRADRAGQAGMIPMTRARGPELADMHLASEASVVGRASDLVRYDPVLEPVVRHLLGHTWVVRDMSAALYLSNNGGARMRYVTLDGERVDPSGAIVGGEPLPRVGVVSRKSELEAVKAELRALAAVLSEKEADHGRRMQQAESLRAECGALRKEIEEGNLEKLSNENDILNLRGRQKTLGEESEIIRSEVREIEDIVRGYDERRETIEGELAEVTQRRDELRLEIETAQRRLAEQQAAAEKLREAVTRLKVDLAEKQAREGGLETGIRAAETAIGDIEAQIAAARARMDDLRTRREKAAEDIRRAESEHERAAAERQALSEETAALAEAHERAQARRAEEAERARVRREEQAQLQGALQTLRLEEQEHRVRMEGLRERVFGEHGVQLEEIADLKEAAEGEEAPEWKAVEEEIAGLRDKIRRMGGINEEAIAEEEGLEIAIAQTEAQRDDLAQAEEDLRNVIRKLNRVSRDRFAKTFEEIRGNFQETFRRVFGGGRADLVLDPEEPDVLEAGIEVLACPPGKDLKSITLLSGGEKAMTTIALLFAIFRSKPSPFCILDEVDAPLDENNITRFTSMVVDYATDSQFIIITHSKRTLEAADVLYGITMQEKGVSKRVAVELDQAVAMNN